MEACSLRGPRRAQKKEKRARNPKELLVVLLQFFCFLPFRVPESPKEKGGGEGRKKGSFQRAFSDKTYSSTSREKKRRREKGHGGPRSLF